MTAVAWVVGIPVSAAEVDERETQLRTGNLASALPRPGTSEGRQLRRWLTQLLVAERVVALESAGIAHPPAHPPALDEVLPDMAARLEIGSIAAAVLATPSGRAAYARVTAAVDVTDADVAGYHARNPARFAPRTPGRDGWRGPNAAVALAEVRPAITAHLRAAARRRAFRQWLDARCAALVELAPGYEHPGDPRQPDNTHRH